MRPEMASSQSPVRGRGPRAVPEERRTGPRYSVLDRQVVVVDLRHGNGGIVLNCSPGGIAIQAVASPLPLPGHELLLYLPGVPKPLDLVGDIVWVNQFHQAGIRFSAVGATTRMRLAEWFEQTARAYPPSAEISATATTCIARQHPAPVDVPPSPPGRPVASPLRSAIPVVPPQSAPKVPKNDSVPWKAILAAAGMAGLGMLLLGPSPSRRTAFDAGAAPRQQTQPSARGAAPSAAAPVIPAPAARPGSQTGVLPQVRQRRQPDLEEEVIIRHFIRPPAASDQDSRKH